MCGIIGYIGSKEVVPVLIEGLRKLEYRGYDSAGVAVVRDGAVDLRRSAGKLSNLEQVIRIDPIAGDYGVGHTRWATHGRPTEENAHPHRDCTGKIVVVHNGIIENYLDLKRELQRQGHKFVTETDTEIVQRIWSSAEDEGRRARERMVRRALMLMRGLFALDADLGRAIPKRSSPSANWPIRSSSASATASSSSRRTSRRFSATRATSSSSATRRWPSSRVRASSSPTSSAVRSPRRRSASCGTRSWPRRRATSTACSAEMLRAADCWRAARRDSRPRVAGRSGQRCSSRRWRSPSAPRFAAVEKVTILACGTSWHAGLVGKYMIERLARVPVEVDYGSEYRYRKPIVPAQTLAVVITQSGETADTLAALREAKLGGARSIAVCNVVGSIATRETDGTIYTHAGPEIGVASTKAFTSQLVALLLLGLRDRASSARRH